MGAWWLMMRGTAERDIKLLKNRNAVLTKKNHARDRLINELKEGAKILEDQLRLMDEKYIELRNKLDWTRQHSQKEVRRIQVSVYLVFPATPSSGMSSRAGASHLLGIGTDATLPHRRHKPHACARR